MNTNDVLFICEHVLPLLEEQMTIDDPDYEPSQEMRETYQRVLHILDMHNRLPAAYCSDDRAPVPDNELPF